MIIELILVLLALPVGYLIAWMARDELVMGRKWFYLIFIVSILLAFWLYYNQYGYITLTLIFIAIVSFISIVKSRDKKWTSRKI